MSISIAITGEGIVSAIGLNKADTLDALINNRSGIGKMKYLDSSHTELPVGEVQMSNDEMKAELGINDRFVSRTSLMGIMAVKQALKDADIETSIITNDRMMLVSGTTVGGMDLTEKCFAEMKQSDEMLECINHHDCGSSTKYIADYFGCFQDSTTISTACSSAENAIILAVQLIQAGMADIVLAGGTEALSKFHLNGFNSLMILDNNRCRPFDNERNGLNLGEGAAFIVLESEEHAKKRGADIHAFINGYGNACDAFHQTASSEDGQGAFLAMTMAMQMAGCKPQDIDYINAHGTGTQNNDISESMAIQRVFNDYIPPVSSTKPFTGHTTSASGAIETVISIMALNNGFIPANLGWKNQMQEGITPSMGLHNVQLKNVMCNSFGFGGNDSSVIISNSPATVDKMDLDVDKMDFNIAAEVIINNIEQLDEIKKYVKPLVARRMGKIMKSSLLASLKALEQAGIDKPDAIITATERGCLEYSENIMMQMEQEGELAVKPTYFMQSTHNTIGSNIAIFTKCHGFNTTFSHGEDSFKWALKQAKLLIASGNYKSVLVGAHDESTQLYRQFMKRMRRDEMNDINSIALIITCGK